MEDIILVHTTPLEDWGYYHEKETIITSVIRKIIFEIRNNYVHILDLYHMTETVL